MYGVSKISSEQNIMLTTFPGAQYSAQSLAEHLDVFAKAGIVVDMICQSTPRGSAVDFSFTTSYDNFAAVMKALPAAAKADARTTKIALRRAAARTLPAASAARKKLGFPVPVRDWLRQEPYTSRVRAVFSRPAAAEFFDPRALHSMLNQHLHGGDCWRQIWCVYSFLIWYEQFFGA